MIVDDYYEHALRLFCEKDTGVARLQASVLDGELERVPIWTAFITNQIRDPAWARRDGPGVVILADLQHFIFTTDYSPQKLSTGEFVLHFAIPSGTALDLTGLCVCANLDQMPKISSITSGIWREYQKSRMKGIRRNIRSRE